MTIVTSVFSQKVAVTFYDSSWLLTTRNHANFYRVGLIDTTNYHYYGEVKEYYMNGNMSMKGIFNANQKVDSFYFYYPSGKLRIQGYYRDNIRYGVWTYYHENGKVKDKLVFNYSFICAIESYDSTGVAKINNGTGKWDFQYYNDSAKSIITVKGEYKDTLRHGDWNYYERSEGRINVDRLECVEKYNNGRFVKGKYLRGGGGIQNIGSPTINILPESTKFEKLENWKATKYASIESYPYLKFLPALDSTELPLDSLAKFPGGLDSLASHFRHEMKFSKSYIESQKERSFMLIIAIDENGELEIFQDPSKASLNLYPTNQTFYNNAMKAVKNLPEWKPAIRNGQKAKNYYTLSISMEDGVISTLLHSRNELTRHKK